MHFSRLGCRASLDAGAIRLQMLRTVGDRTARDAATPDRTLCANRLLRARRATSARRAGACGLERADTLPGGCHTPAEPSTLERSPSVELKSITQTSRILEGGDRTT